MSAVVRALWMWVLLGSFHSSFSLRLSWLGKRKLKAHLPGTQIFQWLLLAPRLLPPLSGPMGHCVWASQWSCCWSVQLNGWRQCPGAGGNWIFPWAGRRERPGIAGPNLCRMFCLCRQCPMCMASHSSSSPPEMRRHGGPGECSIVPLCPRCTAV